MITTPLIEKKKKRYTLSPTPRQRRAAKLMVDVATGKRPDIQSHGQIVIEAGYSPTIENTPHQVLNTTGVTQAIKELGFNEDTAKNVVAQILENSEAKAGDRLKAADMVFKVHGTYAAEKSINVNVDATVDTEKLLELASMMRRNV